ncbi:MAG: LacI family DNA-binding transcriptional regulator [Actinomycetota bacterium]
MTSDPEAIVSRAGKPNRKANIFDVARLAGVSHQTVSRVINDFPSVRPVTRERVQQAIAQLRYSPSPAARALVTKRTRLIGLIAPSTADFGPASIALHFSDAARDARYGVVSVTSVDASASSIRPLVESLLDQRVEAIVLIVTDIAVLSAVHQLDAGVPIVAVAAGARRGTATTSIDQYRGARAAVRHLVELGHRRILHLSGPSTAPDAIERLRGWRDELAASRLVAEEPGHGDWSPVTGYRYGSSLELADRPLAVFVANDQMALGVMSALKSQRFLVPGDVSIVGFDDIPEAAFFDPPLTTVSQDFAALGALTMQRVLIAIEEPEGSAESTPIPTKLVIRSSTARPNAK